MAANMFIYLGDDIKGESEDSNHKEWIEVASYGYGFEQLTTPLRDSSGSTIERVTHNPFTFTKKIDKSSTAILTHVFSGKQLPKVVFEQMRADGGDSGMKYFTVDLEHAVISGYEISGGEGDIPEESITITFGIIGCSYTDKKKEGKGESSGSAQWAIHDALLNEVLP